MRNALLVLALGFAACDGGDDDTDTDTDVGTDTGTETAEEITARRFAELITVTDAAVASDSSCFTPGDAWIEQDVDASLQVTEAVTLIVDDFGATTPQTVDGATINIYESDDVNATADLTVVTDANGEALNTTIDTCMPMSVKVSKEGTKDTYQSHIVPRAGIDELTLNSVANSTETLISSLLGVSLDDDKSVVAGAFYDCAGNPIQNAQVVVRDEDGNIADSLIIRYADATGFPSRDQAATSVAGIWFAFNLPPGDLTAEAYVSDGAGGHDLVGTSEVSSFADAIGIGSIYWGIEGGVWYPDSCLTLAD